MTVAKLAVEIAEKLEICIDTDLVKEGALNHDIGRASTQGVDHAVRGAEIARRLGIEERVVRIIERHVGAGIPQGEAARLGLPPGEYVPVTPEEIVVAYADNLVQGESIVSYEKALSRFRRYFGGDHPAVKRFIAMHETVESWME